MWSSPCRALKARNLSESGFRRPDGAEALEFFLGDQGHPLREIGVTPRVILLDYEAPEVDGLEVCGGGDSRATSARAPLPVVVLTSSKEEPDIAVGVSGWALTANRQVRGLRGLRARRLRGSGCTGCS